MGSVRLNKKERRRLEVLKKVDAGKVSRGKGAELLGLSYRQMLRVVQRYADKGAISIEHGLKNRKSNRRIDGNRRKRILRHYKSKYLGFGPTLAAEYLLSAEKESVGVETLRHWLIDEGLWQARRRGARHRQWRERRECWGELVQMDGSEHLWFESRRRKATLMVMIDDATNWTYARFFEGETTASAMTIFSAYVGWYGLPRALYVDRDTIYEITRDSTVDEALRDVGPLTQFGRAMETLDVELICAHSPQAKGRVERRHGVLQDRLLKALRLKKIKTLEAANQFLDDEFLDDLNERFHAEARSPADLHRSVPPGVKLAHVLCYQEQRQVQNDWTVSWCNRILQLGEKHQRLGLAKKKIVVSELLDGTLRLTFRNETLEWKELAGRPVRQPKPSKGQAPAKPTYKPASTHPWRKGR